MCAELENWAQDAKEDELCESWDSSGICGRGWLNRHVKRCLIILQKE